MHEVLRVGRLDAWAEEGEAGRVVGVEETVARRGQVLGQDRPQQALQLGGTEKKHGNQPCFQRLDRKRIQ